MISNSKLTALRKSLRIIELNIKKNLWKEDLKSIGYLFFLKKESVAKKIQELS